MQAVVDAPEIVGNLVAEVVKPDVLVPVGEVVAVLIANIKIDYCMIIGCLLSFGVDSLFFGDEHDERYKKRH